MSSCLSEFINSSGEEGERVGKRIVKPFRIPHSFLAVSVIIFMRRAQSAGCQTKKNPGECRYAGVSI
jgi:hypothetical protein